MCCQGNDSIVAVGFGPWSNASHSDTNMRESLQFSSRQILTQFKCIESKKNGKRPASKIHDPAEIKENKYIEMKRKAPNYAKR